MLISRLKYSLHYPEILISSSIHSVYLTSIMSQCTLSIYKIEKIKDHDRGGSSPATEYDKRLIF